MKNVVRGQSILVMPAKAGIQYANEAAVDYGRFGILDHPLEPVIGRAKGETRWRMMTVELAILMWQRTTSVGC